MNLQTIQQAPLTKWQKTTLLFAVWYILPVVLGLIISVLTGYLKNVSAIAVFALPIPSYLFAALTLAMFPSVGFAQFTGAIALRFVPLLVLIFASYRFWRSGTMKYRYLALVASLILHGPFLYGIMTMPNMFNY